MDVGMLMAGGMLRLLDREAPADEAFAWANGSALDGSLRLAIAFLAVAALVLGLETGSLRWLWGVLSGLHGSIWL
jgi:hypothetical protein